MAARELGVSPIDLRNQNFISKDMFPYATPVAVEYDTGDYHATLAKGAVTPVAVVGFVVTGLGFGWALTGLSTVVQERAPEELRGRIMALWLVGFLGSRPIAAAVLGGTADLVNVQAAFGVAAVVGLAVALWCRPSNLTGALPSL